MAPLPLHILFLPSDHTSNIGPLKLGVVNNTIKIKACFILFLFK